MAEKEMDVGTVTFGTQDLVNVKLKISDATIGPGERATLNVTLKNLSPVQLSNIQVVPHIYTGSPPVVVPANAIITLDVNETETCGFIIDNAGNPNNASFNVNVHLSNLLGGIVTFHSNDLTVP